MTPVVVLVGCVLLTARPALLRIGSPMLTVTVLFSALLVAGLVVRAPRDERRLRVGPVLVVGLGVFGVGRIVGDGAAPMPLVLHVVLLNTLAAIAEEAFFRRAVYAALAPVGAAFAVVGGAVLFALVHLTMYGAWVLPLDLAAGLVFGWQRWATGRWSVPAATHAVANVFVVV